MLRSEFPHVPVCVHTLRKVTFVGEVIRCWKGHEETFTPSESDMLHSRQDVCIAGRTDETGAEDHMALIHPHTHSFILYMFSFADALTV